jgi:hypothetical protein
MCLNPTTPRAHAREAIYAGIMQVLHREIARMVAHFEAAKPTSRVTQLAQGGTAFLRQLTPPRFVFAPTSLPYPPRTMNSETI